MEQMFCVSKGFFYLEDEIDGEYATRDGFVFPELANDSMEMTADQLKEMLRDHITIGDFDSAKAEVIGNYEDTYCQISLIKDGAKIGELMVTDYFDTRRFEELFSIAEGEVPRHPALTEDVNERNQKALEVCQAVCEKYPEVKSVGLSEPYHDHIIILFDAPNKELVKKLKGYFDYDHPKDLPDGGTQIPVIEGELEKALAKVGLEMGGGWDYVPNDEAARADYEAWLKDNPRPVDPTADYYKWMRRSYYDRTKGKGSKEYAQFQNDMVPWKAKYDKAKAGFAPKQLPGLYFSVQSLGTAAEINAFYAGTNYWGD